MDNMCFPLIDEADYAAFRAIMHNELPITYNEWLDRHKNRVAYYRDTHNIVEVKVKPDQFSAYLNAGSHGANMNSLYSFTDILGKYNKD